MVTIGRMKVYLVVAIRRYQSYEIEINSEENQLVASHTNTMHDLVRWTRYIQPSAGHCL